MGSEGGFGHPVAEEEGEHAGKSKGPLEDWNLGIELETADTAKS